MSNYGEVRLNIRHNSAQKDKMNEGIKIDQSVSFVQMQDSRREDSLAFDDFKPFKKFSGVSVPILEESSPHESQITGKFEQSGGDSRNELSRRASAHYMMDDSLNGIGKSPPSTDAPVHKHYYE